MFKNSIQNSVSLLFDHLKTHLTSDVLNNQLMLNVLKTDNLSNLVSNNVITFCQKNNVDRKHVEKKLKKRNKKCNFSTEN